jgi:small subunit ribosomal protein S20
MIVIHASGRRFNIFPVLFFVFWCKSLPLHPRKLFGIKHWNEMANHKATKKDVRQAAKRRERNKYYGKTTRNAIRDLKALKTGAEATKELPDVASMIDKLAKRGIIHKNKAANLKSKLARKVNALAK